MRLCFVSLFLLSLTCQSQTMFQKSYVGSNAELGWSVLPIEESNFMICGFTKSFGAGLQDMHVMKLNSEGVIVWEKTYGGTGSDRAYCIVNSLEGGYLVGGAETSYDPVGDGDIYIVKMNDEGVVEWEKTYGGTGPTDDVYNIIQSADSSYFVGGRTRSYGAGLDDFYLLKISKNGDLDFSKTYGGNMAEICNDFIQTSTDNLVLVGSTASYGQGSNDAYLVKTDMAGAVSWTKTFGGNQDESIQAIEETLNGNYIVIGYTSSFGEGGYDGFIAKVDPSGNILWSNTYGDDGPQYFYDGIVTSDSGLVCTGIHFGNNGIGDLLLLKTDRYGNQEWSRTYNLIEHSYGITVAETNTGYAVVGSDETANHNTLLIKTNWQGQTGCQDDELDMTYVQNSFTPLIGSGGTVSSGCVVTDVIGQSGITSMTQDTLCIQHCSMSTSVEVSNSSGGAGCDGEISLSVFGGSEPISYQWGQNAENQTTALITNLCAGEYCVNITDDNGCELDSCISISFAVGLLDHKNDELLVYPNPTSSQIIIDFTEQEVTGISIYNGQGSLVLKERVNSQGELKLDVASYESGIYLLLLETNKGLLQRKLIVE